MKILNSIVLFSLLFLLSCGTTDDPPPEEINQLDLTVEMVENSEESEITFMFSYGVPVRSAVTLTINDARGVEVGKPVDTIQQAGRYPVALDASDYANGEYRYELKAVAVEGSEERISTGTFVIDR